MNRMFILYFAGIALFRFTKEHLFQRLWKTVCRNVGKYMRSPNWGTGNTPNAIIRHSDLQGGGGNPLLHELIPS